MIRHKDSHLDHGLTDAQREYLGGLEVSPGDAVVVKTIELPAELGEVPCALYGPTMGDDPVPESEVEYAVRGDRKGESRLVARPARMTNKVTVIAGPHDGMRDVLFTAFGGPAAPREVFECDDDESREFWKEHALAKEVGDDPR